jgi:hypothetical protein
MLGVVQDGKLLRRNMRREFVSTEELHSQLREQGVEDVANVKVARMVGPSRSSPWNRPGTAGPRNRRCERARPAPAGSGPGTSIA